MHLMELLIKKYEDERKNLIEKEQFLKNELGRKNEQILQLEKKLFGIKNNSESINSYSNNSRLNTFSIIVPKKNNSPKKNFSFRNDIYLKKFGYKDRSLFLNKIDDLNKNKGINSYDESKNHKNEDRNFFLNSSKKKTLAIKKNSDSIGNLLKQKFMKFRNNSDFKLINIGSYNFNSEKTIEKQKNNNNIGNNNSTLSITNFFH